MAIYSSEVRRDVYKRQHQQAFDYIKRLFSNNLHLYQPGVLYTDASGVAGEGSTVSTKHEGEHRVIAYANRSLKGAERKENFTSETKI